MYNVLQYNYTNLFFLEVFESLLITSSVSISISLCTLLRASLTNLSCTVMFLKNVFRHFKIENVLSSVSINMSKVPNTFNK